MTRNKVEFDISYEDLEDHVGDIRKLRLLKPYLDEDEGSIIYSAEIRGVKFRAKSRIELRFKILYAYHEFLCLNKNR